jgi:hypothetical protein
MAHMDMVGWDVGGLGSADAAGMSQFATSHGLAYMS